MSERVTIVVSPDISVMARLAQEIAETVEAMAVAHYGVKCQTDFRLLMRLRRRTDYFRLLMRMRQRTEYFRLLMRLRRRRKARGN